MMLRSICRPILKTALRSALLSDDAPTPAYDLNFMGGMPAGLTYTNSSTARTYFGSDGLLKTAVANEPIFEYDPVTLALLGMRWEMEQRTNIILQSTLPGGGAAPTGWTRPGATGTSAPVASIYGSADGAVAYEQSATAQRPFLNQAVSVSANTTYTLSILIEAVTGSISAIDTLLLSGLPAGAAITYPVCPANTAGGFASFVTAGQLDLTLVVAAAAGTAQLRVGIGCSANATGTLKFSRPQFEVGSSRSSFIPTAAASVTRQPDVLTASSISPWYNQSEGSVVFEGIASTPATAQRGMYLFSDGTDNERISGYRASGQNGGVLVVDGGVTQADINTLSSIAQASIFRHALAYKLNDVAGSVNGGTPVVDTSATMPTITGLTLGQGNTSGTQAFMGYARRFSYYNRRLPDAIIQGLSRV